MTKTLNSPILKSKKRHTLNIRARGAVIAFAGLLMVVGGFFALSILKERGGTFSRSPLLLIAGGLLVAIKGFVTLASGLEEPK